MVAIDKPAGFHVHPPEDEGHRISPAVNCLKLLNQQLGRYVYPAHRLDVATSGVLLFALSSESARALSMAFQERRVEKTYFCVVRGWIDQATRIEKHDAVTDIEPVAQTEFPVSVGPRQHPTARYTLVCARPITGRMHQIRRHLASSAHPIVGDTTYGDGAHNRFFRQQLGVAGLLLKAHVIRVPHPSHGRLLEVQAPWRGDWHRLFGRFGVCPWAGPLKVAMTRS